MPGSKVPIVWLPAALDAARNARTFQGPEDTESDRSKGGVRNNDNEEFHEEAPAVDENEGPPGILASTAQRWRAQNDGEEPDDGGRDDRELPRADANVGENELPNIEEVESEGWSDELAQPSTSAHGLLEEDGVRRAAAVIGVSEVLRAWSIPSSSVRALSVQS